jgi:hypothetical protein
VLAPAVIRASATPDWELLSAVSVTRWPRVYARLRHRVLLPVRVPYVIREDCEIVDVLLSYASTQVRLHVTTEQPQLRNDFRDQVTAMEYAHDCTFRDDNRYND